MNISPWIRGSHHITNPMENVNRDAPMIPAGTEPTVFGTTTYNQGQASPTPEQSGKVQSAQIEDAVRTAIGEGLPQAGNQVTTPQKSEITFEELAAKKGFKSPDDLAKAYANIESRASQSENTLKSILDAREESLQPSEELPQQVNTQEDALKIVERVVKKMTRPLEDRVDLQNLFMQNPDAKQYAAEMAREVKANPGISWDAAYRLAKYSDLEQTSREAGKQQAVQMMQQKQEVQAGTGRSTGVGTKTVSLDSLNQMIADRSVPWTEVQKVVKEYLRP